ncbi:MAG: 3-deoxy-manno-octulosonate cytidylyltransferase [Proteobacteria bacterium]|nr:3-deoxy-manno-octulosonate cytidylyltransferase [Pseudomonadota bacterium]
MAAAIIIPVRYQSTRFPGKPLVQIAERSMIERVWRIATAADPTADVIIATDDSRIETHATGFGARVVMTDTTCRNGSERTHQALQRSGLAPSIVVNLQGDTPLTPPHVLGNLIAAMEARSEILIGTPGVRLSLEEHDAAMGRIGRNTGGTYVATALNGQALYFSRFPLPYVRADRRHAVPTPFPFFKHLGIYAFRPQVLAHYIDLPPTPLEELEQLEQLRALEHGIPLHVVEVDLRGRRIASVDTPEDAAEVERILADQGDVI